MWGPVGGVPRGFSRVSEEGILPHFHSLVFNWYHLQTEFFSLELFKISNIKHSLQGILVEGIESLLSQRKKRNDSEWRNLLPWRDATVKTCRWMRGQRNKRFIVRKKKTKGTLSFLYMLSVGRYSKNLYLLIHLNIATTWVVKYHDYHPLLQMRKLSH